jgi:glycine/D-amino acid oxidase-like deaminating enzyme
MKKQSLRSDTSPPKDFPQSGIRVAVVDQKSIGSGETSRTTAHVTFVTDARLHELASRLGRIAAQAFWGAGHLAMRQIEDIVSELKIDCELKRVPGYLFAAIGKDIEKEADSLQHDALLSDEFGFDAEFVESDPIFHRPAVRFPNQLKFHPLKYVNAIAAALPGDGCHVFSDTSGSNIDSEKHELQTDAGEIKYEAVVAATHVPIQGERDTFGAALFQTKLAAYSTYALEAEIESMAESLFWDTNDPYLYLRFDARDRGSSVIIGGEDYKTGQEEETESRYELAEEDSGEDFSNREAEASLVRSGSRNPGWLTLHWRSSRTSIPRHRIFWQWNDSWHVFSHAYSRPHYEKIQPVDRIFRAKSQVHFGNVGLYTREQRFSYLFH